MSVLLSVRPSVSRRRIALQLFAVTLCALAIPGASRAADDPDFNLEVRPLLAARCLKCHGGVKRESGLSLLHRLDAIAPRTSGRAAIVPGDPAASELLRRVTTDDPDDRMPPSGRPLTAAEVELLRRWISGGAAYAVHWAYVPPRRVAPPEVRGAARLRNPIDAFVQARLEREGLEPAPEADRRTLIRRLSFDLIGLPPTPEDVEAFVADESPEAYAALVDRLLDSPRFGERWARMWLDMARYADTQGYEKDNRRTIWQYRDWVIRAFNDDMPFDRFTVEQLAGDLLPEPTVDQLIATAFHRNTMTNTEGGTDDEEFRVAAVMDRVATTWQVWMGTTFGCTQCHSHPYDPFEHEEYYRFFALLNNTEDHDQPDERPTIATPTAEERARREELEAELAAARDELAAAGDGDAATHEARKKLEERVAALEKQVKGFSFTTTPILRELAGERRRATHVFIRGSFLSKGEQVTPGVPKSLPPIEAAGEPTRLDLARWLVSRENPLTARVTVNRFWEKLFGAGFVEVSEDFGSQGTPPTHPELLDWLAVEFMETHRWSVKGLLRQIVTSATYRQSSRASPAARERDPRNQLLSRGPRFRLEAEMVRDQILAVSGLLSDRMFGPSVMPPQPDGVWQVVYSGDRWVTSAGEDRFRRGVYTFWRRTSPYPSMLTFDATSREYCAVRRLRTNTPLQALVTMNDPVFVEAAEALARRVVAILDATDAERIARAFALCLARPPLEAETARLLALLESERRHYRAHPEDAVVMATSFRGALAAGQDPAEVAAWTVVANVLMNLDEFLTKG